MREGTMQARCEVTRKKAGAQGLGTQGTGSRTQDSKLKRGYSKAGCVKVRNPVSSPSG